MSIDKTEQTGAEKVVATANPSSAIVAPATATATATATASTISTNNAGASAPATNVRPQTFSMSSGATGVRLEQQAMPNCNDTHSHSATPMPDVEGRTDMERANSHQLGMMMMMGMAEPSLGGASGGGATPGAGGGMPNSSSVDALEHHVRTLSIRDGAFQHQYPQVQGQGQGQGHSQALVYPHGAYLHQHQQQQQQQHHPQHQGQNQAQQQQPQQHQDGAARYESQYYHPQYPQYHPQMSLPSMSGLPPPPQQFIYHPSHPLAMAPHMPSHYPSVDGQHGQPFFPSHSPFHHQFQYQMNGYSDSRQIGEFHPQFQPAFFSSSPIHHPSFSPPVTPFGPMGSYPLSSRSPNHSPGTVSPSHPASLHGAQRTPTAVPSSPALMSSSPALPVTPVNGGDLRSTYITPVRSVSTRHQGARNASSKPNAMPPPVVSNDHFPPLGTQRPKHGGAWPTPDPSPQRGEFTSPSPPIQNGWSMPPQRTAVQKGLGISYPPKQWNAPKLPPPMTIEAIQRQLATLNDFAKEYIEMAKPSKNDIELRLDLHKKLSELLKTLVPSAELRLFGSVSSGFATVGSDLDLMLQDPEGRSPQEIAAILNDGFAKAGYDMFYISKTRVPVLKVTETPVTNPDAGTIREPIVVDIGFIESPLAFVNTELLRVYSLCDPRVHDMVMFVKWWSKKRNINTPYRGTLNSYGYILMVIHYLINIVRPAVLPNLQHWPIPKDMPKSETLSKCGKYEIWFWKDEEEIKQLAASGGITSNREDVGSLLRGFFEYYAYEFNWNKDVISIRTKGGILTKFEKNWTSAVSRVGKNETEYTDRYLFAIEDPFEIDHNVARVCTYRGLSRMRDEFKRAALLLRFKEGEAGLRTKFFAEVPDEPSPPPLFTRERAFSTKSSPPSLSESRSSSSSAGTTGTTTPDAPIMPMEGVFANRKLEDVVPFTPASLSRPLHPLPPKPTTIPVSSGTPRPIV